MTAIALGKRLGVPAPLVARLPLHWIAAALVLGKAEQIEHERQAKRAEQARRKVQSRRKGLPR